MKSYKKQTTVDLDDGWNKVFIYWDYGVDTYLGTHERNSRGHVVVFTVGATVNVLSLTKEGINESTSKRSDNHSDY